MIFDSLERQSEALLKPGLRISAAPVSNADRAFN
jgi:hypothetical protein